MNYNDLILVPVPAKTDTYSPISHKNIVEEIKEEIDKKSLYVVNETYNVARGGNQLIGYMDIHSANTELGMRLAFRNSYDKSMSVAFVAGSTVWICSNGMISGEVKYLRKHTGEVASELKNKIVSGLNELERVFRLNESASVIMKDIEINKLDSAELAGRMFIEHDIIKSEQLSILKKEINDPSYNYNADNSLWQFYNNVTYAFKGAHPTNYIKQHIDFHNFIEKEYNLV